MKQLIGIAFGMALAMHVLMAGAVHAQTTTFGFWKKETSVMNTYLLTGEMVSSEVVKNNLIWDSSILVAETTLKPEEIVRNASNLFVVPVTEEIEKGVRNHQFVLARGKATSSLPKLKDEHGFYMGASGLQVIASVYVDPGKMGTRYAGLYLAALNSLVLAGSKYTSQDGLAAQLKENYWYEGMGNVHFESADLLPPMSDTTTLQSMMPHAHVHSHAEYLNDLGLPKREDCFADVLEIRQKGGKSSFQVYFLSYTGGLIYHDLLSTDDRKAAVFTKKDIYKFGQPQIRGKK